MKGGKRTGAGRPKGSPNKNQALLRDYAQKVACGEQLNSPLETILEAMRQFYGSALQHQRSNTVFIAGCGKTYNWIELLMLSAEVAVKAARYVHPTLASVQSDVTVTIGAYEAALLELEKAPAA